MFFTYVRRELRRRRRQAIVVALGLALGIGLVVSVSAMAAGVRTAQGAVLQSLYGVGTDVTVTQSATAGSGPRARFGLNPGSRGREGKAFSRDQLLSDPGLGTIPAAKVSTLSTVAHVKAVAGGLSLTSIHLQGRFATAPDGSTGGTIISGSGNPTALPSVAPVNVSSYSVTGVDVTVSDVGPVTPAEITSGRWFRGTETKANVAVVDASYAKHKKLKVGSTVTIGGTEFTVIGIATPPAGGQTSNLYIPLARAQSLAGMTGKVNRIYVKADSASNIASVKRGIQAAIPKATVTTASDLASQVTGSLASASSLAGKFGTWLSAVALIAAFAVAILLTLSAVGRRTREFGTLKAVGWRSRRVVGQVMGEAVVEGVLGAVLGVAAGLGGAFLIAHLAPNLQAVISQGPGGAGPVGPVARALTRTISVPLTAPVSLRLLMLAIGLAVAGGILAGSFGGWRAARLRPAEALRRVE